MNYALIGVCLLVFALQTISQDNDLVMRFGMVPARISNPGKVIVQHQPILINTGTGMQQVTRVVKLPAAAVPEWTTLLTCVFLHGGLMHLAGNLWFLFIFGDNVEDRLGHFGYLVFYLGCGLAASLSHYLLSAQSVIPTIGASGAIAGVMGAYLLLYPRAMVVSLVPILFILQILVIPAPVFLGLWFVIQLVQGTYSLGSMSVSGVAWWAHIGGFAAGFIVAKILQVTEKTHPQVTVVRPGTERPTVFRLRP